jgi:hypothetical protein
MSELSENAVLHPPHGVQFVTHAQEEPQSQ